MFFSCPVAAGADPRSIAGAKAGGDPLSARAVVAGSPHIGRQAGSHTCNAAQIMELTRRSPQRKVQEYEIGVDGLGDG